MNPKLKENIWRIDEKTLSATLIVGGQNFSIPFQAALIFMGIRSHCTGHNSIESIARKADLPEQSIRELLNSLAPSGILLSENAQIQGARPLAVRQSLLRIVDAWGLELAGSYIGNELGRGQLSRTVLVGWLLEMYHYIKDFPKAIEIAYKSAPDDLKPIYLRYCKEETGHEGFVLRALMRLGLSEKEIQSSTPLISTRSIGLLMKDLFEKEPIALLVVAALVEAQEFNNDSIDKFKLALTSHYGVPNDALDPYFEHQEIDVRLGHCNLLRENIDWIERLDADKIDQTIDAIHDIKHAFDLQSLEIKQYYGQLNGRYFPRQSMNYAAIS